MQVKFFKVFCRDITFGSWRSEGYLLLHHSAKQATPSLSRNHPNYGKAVWHAPKLISFKNFVQPLLQLNLVQSLDTLCCHIKPQTLAESPATSSKLNNRTALPRFCQNLKLEGVSDWFHQNFKFRRRLLQFHQSASYSQSGRLSRQKSKLQTGKTSPVRLTFHGRCSYRATQWRVPL